MNPANQQVLDAIHTSNSIWLTTHPQADGDGLACEAAMLTALRKMGKSAKIMNFEAPGNKYRFLFERIQNEARPVNVQVFDPELDPAPPDLVILFDTNDFRLIEPLVTWLKSLKETGIVVPIVIVDHHQGEAAKDALHWTDSEAASSGEVLLALLDELKVEIDASVATPLYASLVFDTQNFRFIRASPRSHLMAARLLPLVHEPERIHEWLLANLTPSKLGFLAAALSAMGIEAEGTLAIVVLPRHLFTRYSADASDSGDVIDMALNVSSVKIALLLREEAAGRWKISLRSKRGFSVLEAATTLGGGGHRNASGATLSGDAEEIEALVKPLLLAEIRSKMAL